MARNRSRYPSGNTNTGSKSGSSTDGPTGIQSLYVSCADCKFNLICMNVPSLLASLPLKENKFKYDDFLQCSSAVFGLALPTTQISTHHLPFGPLSLFCILYGVVVNADIPPYEQLSKEQKQEFLDWGNEFARRSADISLLWENAFQSQSSGLTTTMINSVLASAPELRLHQTYKDHSSPHRTMLQSLGQTYTINEILQILSTSNFVWLYGNRCLPLNPPDPVKAFKTLVKKLCSDINDIVVTFGVVSDNKWTTSHTSVPGDGDCLFHSIILTLDLPTSVQELRTIASIAAQQEPYSDPQAHGMPEQVARKFAEKGYYNSHFGDLIVAILAHTLEINIEIYQPLNLYMPCQKIGETKYSITIGLVLERDHYQPLQLSPHRRETNMRYLKGVQHRIQSIITGTLPAMSVSEPSTNTTSIHTAAVTTAASPLDHLLTSLQASYHSNCLLINGIPIQRTKADQIELIQSALHQWELIPDTILDESILNHNRLRFINTNQSQASIFLTLSDTITYGRFADPLLSRLPAVMIFSYDDMVYPSAPQVKRTQRHLFGQFVDPSLQHTSELGSIVVCRGMSQHGSIIQAQRNALENLILQTASSPHIIFTRIHELSHWFTGNFNGRLERITPLTECVISVELLSTNGPLKEADRDYMTAIRQQLQVSINTPREIWHNGFFLSLHLGYSFFPGRKDSKRIPDCNHYMYFDPIDNVVSAPTAIHSIASCTVLPRHQILDVILVENTSKYLAPKQSIDNNQLIIVWESYRFLSEPELIPILKLTKPSPFRARRVQEVLYGLPFTPLRSIFMTPSAQTSHSMANKLKTINQERETVSLNITSDTEKRFSRIETALTALAESVQLLLRDRNPHPTESRRLPPTQHPNKYV